MKIIVLMMALLSLVLMGQRGCIEDPCEQDFAYTARESELSIYGNAGEPCQYFDQVSYDELDLFDEALDDRFDCWEISLAGSSSQKSSLADQVMVATGEVYSRAFDDYGSGGSYSWAENQFEVTFALAMETPIEISGSLERVQGSDPAEELSVEVLLAEESGVPIFLADEPGTLDYRDTLGPGTYRFAASAYVYADLGAGGGDAYVSGRANYNARLEIVCGK